MTLRPGRFSESRDTILRQHRRFDRSSACFPQDQLELNEYCKFVAEKLRFER